MLKTDNYKVSILVPIYGVEKYIERCARFLFEQTFIDLEYIFVDDHSPDRSIEILQKVLDEFPHRREQVRIIQHKENKGLSCARNTAVANASGEFILHVDSDDYIEKETIERCVKKQQENNADIVSFGCYREYQTKTIIQLPTPYKDSKEMCLSLIKKRIGNEIMNTGIWGRLIRRSLYLDNHIEAEPGINMAEDYQVITRLSYYAKNIGFIKEPLYHYNLQNSDSYVNNKSLKSAYQSDRSFKIVFDFFLNKGDEFIEAIHYGLSHHLIRLTIDGINNDFGKEYYNQNVSRWYSLPSKIRNNVPILRRYLFINYTFAKVYIAFVRYIKRKMKK